MKKKVNTTMENGLFFNINNLFMRLPPQFKGKKKKKNKDTVNNKTYLS